MLIRMTRFNVECEKRIKWSYFREEESFNTDDFEKNTCITEDDRLQEFKC